MPYLTIDEIFLSLVLQDNVKTNSGISFRKRTNNDLLKSIFTAKIYQFCNSQRNILEKVFWHLNTRSRTRRNEVLKIS